MGRQSHQGTDGKVSHKNILSLSERTQQIGEIIETVNDIADQSQPVGPERGHRGGPGPGKRGRGFAVVAGEVRSLAVQSREATAQGFRKSSRRFRRQPTRR